MLSNKKLTIVLLEPFFSGFPATVSFFIHFIFWTIVLSGNVNGKFIYYESSLTMYHKYTVLTSYTSTKISNKIPDLI